MLFRLLSAVTALFILACSAPPEESAASQMLGDLSPSELQEYCAGLADTVIEVRDAGVDNATILLTFANGAGITPEEAQEVFRLCIDVLP